MDIFWRFSKRYTFRYAWWYLGGCVAVFITQMLAIGIIDETKNAIDAVRAPGGGPDVVGPFVLTIVVYALLLVVIRTLSRLLIFTPGRMIEYHVRNDYYSSLLYLQRDFFSAHESGDLVSRCSNDITFIRAAYGFGFLQVVNVTITMVLGFGAMVAMDAATAGFIAIPMVISLAIIMGGIRYMFSYWRLANEQVGQLSSLTLASYRGAASIQNYHAEPAIEARFQGLNDAYLDTQTTVTAVRAFIIPLVTLVVALCQFLILWVVGQKVVDGLLTVGQVMAFLGYIAMLMPPLLSLGWMLNVFNRAVPAIERLEEIMDAEPKLAKLGPGETEQTQAWDPQSGFRVNLRNLSFSFPGTEDDADSFKLRDVNLTLTPGKVVGVVGPLGSGKSALLDTIMRLNYLTPGQMFLNGRDAAYMEPSQFRDHFSFAPQRALLFSTSLRRNLETALPFDAWGQPETEKKLLDALRFAGFDLDPDQFPEGLETQVGEKGVMLSGGQRQRIALARALLKDADVYILDDVLSAVDHETEKAIISNIREFAPGKIFIIASHRVSAIQWADEILVLDEGQVKKRGSHQALVKEPGFYRDIYLYQSEHGDEDVAS